MSNPFFMFSTKFDIARDLTQKTYKFSILFDNELVYTQLKNYAKVTCCAGAGACACAFVLCLCLHMPSGEL